MTMTEAETTFGGGVVLLERRDGIATVTINRPSQHNALSKATWAGHRRGRARRRRRSEHRRARHARGRPARLRRRRRHQGVRDDARHRGERHGSPGHRPRVPRGDRAGHQAANHDDPRLLHRRRLRGRAGRRHPHRRRPRRDRHPLGEDGYPAGPGVHPPAGRAGRPGQRQPDALPGLRFPAPRALQMGLVNEVVPADALEQHTYQLAATIRDAAHLGALGEALHPGNRPRPVPPVVRRLGGGAGLGLRSPEFRKGVRAFMEKRTPHFNGQENHD